MKKLYVLLIACLVGIGSVVIILNSCKKEEEPHQDYPEYKFINELKRSWYVGYYSSSSPSVSFDFDGDSIINQNDVIYTLGDSVLCTLVGIENIQYWTITETNDVLYLKTEDLCGVINNYHFKYDNYQSFMQTFSPNDYLLRASVSLVGQDSTISFDNFELMVTDGVPSASNISFHIDKGYKRCYLYPRD